MDYLYVHVYQKYIINLQVVEQPVVKPPIPPPPAPAVPPKAPIPPPAAAPVVPPKPSKPKPCLPPVPPKPEQKQSNSVPLSTDNASTDASHEPHVQISPPKISKKPQKSQSHSPVLELNPHPPLESLFTPSTTNIADIDSRPQLPTPDQLSNVTQSLTVQPKSSSFHSKYPDIHAFIEHSGWFKPTVDMVLCQKMNMSVKGFRRLTSGVYLFQHKFEKDKRFVGKSMQLFNHLTKLFSGLYEKLDEDMDSFERILRYSLPDAKDWNVRVWAAHPEKVDLEMSKGIIQFQTLQPLGLNTRISFTTKNDFYTFCEWYTEFKTSRKNIRRF